MHRRILRPTLIAALCFGALACSSGPDEVEDPTLSTPIPRALKESRTEDGLLMRPFDTNGDGNSDVVKYFTEKPDPDDPSELTRTLTRLEMDLNYDGLINVRREYDQLGKLDSEYNDSDLDGRFDSISRFEGKELISKALLEPGSGKTLETRYYAANELIRVERDTTGDSRVDYWEYYERGILERIGRDFNADGRADSWQKR